MKYILQLILIIILSFSAYAVDVEVASNKSGCTGLVLGFFNVDSKYVTYKNLPSKLPENISKELASKKEGSKKWEYINSFFRALISKEVSEEGVSAPLNKLSDKELYNFVVTDKEIRFASSSRGKLSLKNLASKHAQLANGDKVFYAGEAWLENGTLVVNHNSGTFRPNSKYLSDVASYFQENFGVSKVLFSDVLPIVKKKTLSDHISDFKAFLMSRITTLEEFFVGLIARDSYKGKVMSIGLNGGVGDDIVFEVTDFIGSGFFGVVHKVKITSMSEKARSIYSHLLTDGKIREDLVVKFPHNVPLLNKLPSINIFDQTIIKESDEMVKLKDIVTHYEQSAADILVNGRIEKPFLIKRMVKASSIQNLSKSMVKLSDEQVLALKRDIYDMAIAVSKDMDLDLDIKAENIAWDFINKKFVMYEMSIKRKTTGFYIKNGFDGYLNYVNQRLQYHATHRSPSSVGIKTLKMCDSNRIEVPEEFKRNFLIPNMSAELNLAQGELRIESDELDSCIMVDSLLFNGNESILSIRTKGQSNNFLQISLHRESSNGNIQYNSRFTIFNGAQPLGASIITELD